MLWEVELVDSDANLYSECKIRGGLQTWHRLSIHSSAAAGKQMLTAQRRQPPSKFTDRSLSLSFCRTTLPLYIAWGSAETQTDTFQLVPCTSCRQNNKVPTSEEVWENAYCALKGFMPWSLWSVAAVSLIVWPLWTNCLSATPWHTAIAERRTHFQNKGGAAFKSCSSEIEISWAI